MDYKKIKYEVNDELAFIGFGLGNDKSMTTLTIESLTEMDHVLSEIEKKIKSKEVKGVIVHSLSPRCFIAGMDITIIEGLKTQSDAQAGAEKGQKLFNKLEDLKVPKVACVHGACMGGGLELALACNTIIASDSSSTQLALPEVKLGVMPGFGGTYRLPKKIGLPQSLDMILSGKSVPAKKAKKIGLVKEVYPKERLVEMAKRIILQKEKSTGSFKDSLEKMASDNFISRKIIFQKARENVLKKTKGFYQAPLKIIDVMDSGGTKSRNSYLEIEAKAFGELCISSQCRNLLHVFFLMDGSKKIENKESIIPINRGAVLGAGTMGGGIAWLMASAGNRPYMKDINKEGLELGLKQASSVFRSSLKRKKISKDEFERLQNSIMPTLNFNGFKKVDLVIEAIVENLEVKKKVFKELESHVRSDCLLTTNTSSLSVTDMCVDLEDKSRFAGLHFFNPVNRMPLVEIVRHKDVSEETIRKLYLWALKAKKTPVVVGDGPGFLVNRILVPMLGEAIYLLMEGVPIEELDKAVLNFGMPMGPCRLMDEIGLDVLKHVGEIMHEGLGERAKPHEVSPKFSESGFLGRKNSKGFFLYDEKGKPTGTNPELEKLLPSEKIEMGQKEIQMRIFLPMINESASALENKIVTRAHEVDLGLIFGTGFPPFRGGLLKYADSEGVDRILDSLREFDQKVEGVRYKPNPFLISLVEEKKKFYDY